MLRVKNNDPRLLKELFELPNKNNKLYRILKAGAEYSQVQFGLDMVVTSIYRSPAEYTALYAPNPPPRSLPHATWESADLRSSIYTQEQISSLLSFFNQFSVFKGTRRCAMYHAIPGGVAHFHVQAEKEPDYATALPNKDSKS